jgi:hypothetical protein
MWRQIYIKDQIYIVCEYLSFLYFEVAHENKILKYFVNVSNDMTETFFKSVEGMTNRYELVTNYTAGI